MNSPRFFRRLPFFAAALFTAVICALLLPPANTLAAPFVVPKASLQPPQVTFSEVPNGTAINGLTINGFTFSESSPTGGNLFTRPDSGSFPSGGTNNITGDKASSIGVTSNYVLTVNLASPATAFGFGFASASGTVLVTLFNGTTNLGSLVFATAPDPVTSGGFAGIGNTTAFTSVQIKPTAGSIFAVDNFAAFNVNAVPESGSGVALLALSLTALAGAARRFKLAST